MKTWWENVFRLQKLLCSGCILADVVINMTRYLTLQPPSLSASSAQSKNKRFSPFSSFFLPSFHLPCIFLPINSSYSLTDWLNNLIIIFPQANILIKYINSQEHNRTFSNQFIFLKKNYLMFTHIFLKFNKIKKWSFS